jgi:hypothetical protein
MKHLTEHHVRISEFASTLWQGGRRASVVGSVSKAHSATPDAHALMERLLKARSILTIHLSANLRADDRYVLLAVDELVAEVANGLERMVGRAAQLKS